MITEEQIQQTIDEMNQGGPIPEGVEAWALDRKKMVFTEIYFEGLGLYQVDCPDPLLIMTDAEVIEIKGN
jgi:hypothetical protein